MHSYEQKRAWTRFGIAILIFIVLWPLAGCNVTPPPPLEKGITPAPAECDRVLLVGIEAPDPSVAAAVADDAGAQLIDTSMMESGFPVALVCAPDADLSVMSSDERVAYIEEDFEVQIPEEEWNPEEIDDVDAQGVERQWHLATIQAIQAWARATGLEIVVAILDTGVDLDHPELAPRLVEGNSYVGGSPNDRHGHGTHVAGIVAAILNQSQVVGVAHEAKIRPMKVLGDNGSGSISGITRAIIDSAGPGVVINMSLGSNQQSRSLEEAVQFAVELGTTVVAAAGNSNTSRPSYPGCSEGVLGIAATDQRDRRASFSNYGPCVDLAAPGVSIHSTLTGGRTGSMSGTSMASPVAAAVAALLLSAGAPPEMVEAIMEETAKNVGDTRLGAGRVDALAAVLAVPAEPTALPPTDEPPMPTAAPTARPTAAPTNVATPPNPAPERCTATALLRRSDGTYSDGVVLVPCPNR